MNRRDFFRSLGVAAGAAVVPIPAMPKAPVVVPVIDTGMYSFAWSVNAAIGTAWYASDIIIPNPRSSFKLILDSDKPMKISGGKELRSPLTYGD